MRRALLTLSFLATLAQATAAETAHTTVTLRLKNGTTLIGSVLEETPEIVRVHVEGIGTIDVQAAAIVDRNAGTSGALNVPASTVPPAHIAAREEAAPAKPKWTRTLMLSGNYVSAPFEQGNLNGTISGLSGRTLGLPGSQINSQLQMTLQRTTKITDWWIGASGNFATAQPRGDLVNAQQVRSDFRRHFSADWYALSLTTFSSDRIRHIRDAFQQIVGVGHRIVDTPRNRFDLIAGVEGERAYNNTKYDGRFLEGFGVVETYHFGTDKGVGIDQGIVWKTIVQDASLYSVQSYVSVNAPLTKALSLTVNLQSTYDRMLRLQRTDVPANAFYPGSPAGTFFATNPRSTQLTTGVQLRF